MRVFLIVQGLVFNLFNISFAARLYQQFSAPYIRDSPTRRAGRIFCKDPVVFLSFIACPAAFVFSIVGLVWAADSRGHHSMRCSEELLAMATWSSVLMIAYLAFGWVVMLMSLCMECGRYSALRSSEHTPGGSGGAVPTAGAAPQQPQQPQQWPPEFSWPAGPTQDGHRPSALERLGAGVGKAFYPSAPPYYDLPQPSAPPAEGEQVLYPHIYGTQEPAIGVPVSSATTQQPQQQCPAADDGQQNKV